MEREPRRKSVARRQVRRRGGSSRQPHVGEERVVKPFPPSIQFGHEGQRERFNKLMSRPISTMKYMSAYALEKVGLLNEVNMYIARMGWEAFVMMQNPTYVIPTCEFLSSFEFDENEAMLNFRLGNQDHSIGLFELNDVFHFPKDQDANVNFDRDTFWGEITNQPNARYQPRVAKDSNIHSHALRYLHRLMAHCLFPRKEGDSVVTIIELNLLYCMVNDRKLDICHVIATKLRDVANKRIGAIKVGGLVLAIANYLGFNVEEMPYNQLYGNTRIDLNMMEAMGMITLGYGGEPTLVGVQAPHQPMEEEEEDEATLQQVMERLDNLELQVGVIDSNVDEINHNVDAMRQEVRDMNQNLVAYLTSQRFFPPPT